MFGKSLRLSPLESRKQLLLAESELNRVRLMEDVSGLKEGVCALGKRARSLGSLASSAAVLMAGVAACRPGKGGEGGRKRAWLPAILKGAGLVSNLWLAFRARRRVPPEN